MVEWQPFEKEVEIEGRLISSWRGQAAAHAADETNEANQ